MTTLADAFATAAFKNRNPSWAEYEAGSPCDRRAIVARWQEIKSAPILKDEDWKTWGEAFGRLYKAGNETLPERRAAYRAQYGNPGEPDHVQGDYDFVDSRQHFEFGE